MSSTRGLLIGAEEVQAQDGSTFSDTDPFTGDLVATVAASKPADVGRAVRSAHEAFTSWSQTSPGERRGVFLKAADLMDAKAQELALAMTAETGGTFGWGMFNAGFAASILREAAASVTFPLGQVLATDTPGALSLAIRQPSGVVAAFAPWNAPLILGMRAVAIAIAMGNTVVLKPSEQAPLTSGLLLADLFREAGLPAGVCNVLTNDPADAATIAETLIADPLVTRVSFTGSTRVGRIIGELAARNLKPAVLELGGKNSLIVLKDANLEYATQAVAFAVYMNSGQICMSADRVMVQREVAPDFIAQLSQRAASLPAGDPRDPHTVVGPLINQEAAQRVAAIVGEAVSAGSRLETGGGAPQGAVLAPTVLSGVNDEMRINREEIFGPVCTVGVFDSEDEAVEAANSTHYGLTAGILTEDIRRGYAIARRLHTGIVHVNDQSVDDEAQAPFGGVGDSGYGRFGGQAGVDAFTTTRWITLQMGHRPFPF
ncbi:MAG TPA: aldehyde dehydrogenase family protein [Candidatus Acidoferrales bacterium]|nr:aldehyde dehydrogenase family protein [Candidatus Acidoferrales bacterium]